MSSSKKTPGRARQPAPAEAAPRPGEPPPALVGEFIGKEEARGAAASADAPSDEDVVERVEHLSHGVGWLLISAGVVGLVVPGVLGTPFLVMGALALWPGNRKTVERWRQGHSPKMFHGSMRQINRFLDDLERRYPRIEKKK